MKIKLSEFKKLITEMVLMEINVLKIPKTWLGTYAFVLAYNRALDEGLFPRNQKLNIEFTENEPSVFMNGTVLINPNEHSQEFFLSGPGHDMLHALTQNSQVMFGTFKGTKAEHPEDRRSTNNQNLFKKGAFLAVLRDGSQMFKVNLFDLLPIPDIKTGVKLEFENKIILRNYFSELRNILEKRFHFSDLRLEPFFSKLKKTIEPLTYYHSSQNLDTHHPTHGLEEKIGNLVSDTLAFYIINSKLVTEQTLENIKDTLSSFLVKDKKRFEFRVEPGIYDDYLKQKWIKYFFDILPRFMELYNIELLKLKKTKLGAETSEN